MTDMEPGAIVQRLAPKMNNRTITDDEFLALTIAITRCPGGHSVRDPQARVTVGGKPIEDLHPMLVVQAIERREAGLSQPGDDELLKRFIKTMRDAYQQNKQFAVGVGDPPPPGT